jgi:hypothetical protein
VELISSGIFHLFIKVRIPKRKYIYKNLQENLPKFCAELISDWLLLGKRVEQEWIERIESLAHKLHLISCNPEQKIECFTRR